MKGSKQTSFIIFSGVLVLCVFAFVVAYNIIPRGKGSNSYYVKVGETMSAKIESMTIVDDTLVISTSGDAKEYCVKTTRTTPDNNNLCWKEIIDNKAEIKIYGYKQYYIWIKDTTNSISNPMTLNANE